MEKQPIDQNPNRRSRIVKATSFLAAVGVAVGAGAIVQQEFFPASHHQKPNAPEVSDGNDNVIHVESAKPGNAHNTNKSSIEITVSN